MQGKNLHNKDETVQEIQGVDLQTLFVPSADPTTIHPSTVALLLPASLISTPKAD